MSFIKDVAEGLSARQKKISSKYFYDAAGDQLFQRIMELPEYYLTNCELEIFVEKVSEILDAFNNRSKKFDLIEFGAGDGTKTQVLIEELFKSTSDFTYIPIDISEDVLNDLTKKFSNSFPGLNIRSVNSTYFDALDQINHGSSDPKLVLFLGSSIGNFSNDDAVGFLRLLRSKLNFGDQVIIGFDLKKNPHTILAAYNDSEGVTKEFNLNLLKRINTELGGHFKLSSFDHYPYYDPESGLAKSYLVSLEDQTVRIDKCELDIHFRKGETIHTEISKKYDIQEIEQLVVDSGFTLVRHFFDSKMYYTNSLIQVQ